jgi:hypothetical protein
MELTEFSWTNYEASCNDILVVFTPTVATLTLSKSSTTMWEIEPADSDATLY